MKQLAGPLQSYKSRSCLHLSHHGCWILFVLGMHPVFVSTLSWFKKAGEFSLFIFFYKVKYIMEPRSISGNLDQWKLDDLDSYHLAAQNLHPFLSCQVSSPPKKVLHGASPPNIFHIFVNPWSLQQKIILHLMSFCVNCFLFRDFFSFFVWCFQDWTQLPM